MHLKDRSNQKPIKIIYLTFVLRRYFLRWIFRTSPKNRMKDGQVRKHQSHIQFNSVHKNPTLTSKEPSLKRQF